MSRLIAAIAAGLLLSAGASVAQAPGPQLISAATQAKDLTFPKEPTPLPTSPRIGIYKPDGPGPFPALILHHQCGGLTPANTTNRSMLEWAKLAVSRGYVAFLIDSLGPRGVDTVCMGPKGNVFFSRGVRDAVQAAQHLRKFNFVDKNRIAHAGFSWGAMVAVMASSRSYSAGVGGAGEIAAFVSFYPGCYTIRPAKAPPYEVIYPDISRPLLVLMGGKDTETPPEDCVPRLQKVRSAGAPVEWHSYPDATHCWDCQQWHGFSKTDFKGARVTYLYDAKITTDSASRMFDFLTRQLKPKQ
jgi:dienelactone hydrolase